MKSWEPDQEFERSDFPRNRKQTPPIKPAPDTVQKKVTSWRPPSVETASKPGAPKPEVSKSQVLPVIKPRTDGPRIINAANPGVTPASDSATTGGAMRAGPSAKMLGDVILENLENAATLLRRMYWDKKVEAVSSKRKIKVIVSFAGTQAIKALTAVLTPMECQQFLELTRAEAPCDAHTAEGICREFISKLAKL
ncbi:MAG: hypothetical protein K8S54_18915 [Spirochaetia bacterium]|nr:hypothetical protein [Spirochaetia bacterium]